MIGFLRDWVMNIVILVVLLVLLEILLPSGKMKKFVALVSGFVLMLAIIHPFIGFLKDGVDFKALHSMNSSLMERSELKAQSRLLQDKQMKQVTEVYKGKLVQQIEAKISDMKGIKVVKSEVEINEDSRSDSYGEIKSIKLILRSEQNSGDAKPAAKIEKVEVKRNDGKSTRIIESDAGLKSEIESRVTGLMGIEPERISISFVK